MANARQKVYLEYTPAEARAVAAGDAAVKELKQFGNSDSAEAYARLEELTDIVAVGKKARAALSTSKTNRRNGASRPRTQAASPRC